MPGVGLQPDLGTSSDAANFGSLGTWAGATQVDWFSGWTTQLTNIATGLIHLPLYVNQLIETAAGGSGTDVLGEMIWAAFTAVPQGLVLSAGELANAIVQALGGGAGAGSFDSVLSILQFIPGGNIATLLLAAVIPGLDATKIISGVFGTGLIPGLDVSKIVSGVFGGSFIPGLDASKIVSGVFPQSMVSGLVDALAAIPGVAPILNMLVGLGFIPASMIGGGASGNLVPKPDFAAGLDGWVTDHTVTGGDVDPTWESANGHTAVGAMKFTLAGGAGAQLGLSEMTDYLPVEEGQLVDLDAWYRWSGVTVTGSPQARMYLAEYDVDKVWLRDTATTAAIAAASGGWLQLVAVQRTVPADTKFVRVKVGAFLPGGGAMWWDDASVIKSGGIQNALLGGLFGGGSTFLGGLIPGLDASKITSGIFGTGLIPGLDVSKIVSGVFGTGFIPGLDVTKIISGVFGGGFIPSLDASKITTGTFGTGLIPGLDVSKIISGVFGTSFIPGLDVAKIISGVFGAGFIPSLDASKITSGTFGNSLIPGLGDIADLVFQAINGGTSTGNALSTIKTSLQNIPGANIVSTLLASVIPGLDVSKIISGVFGGGFIPSLDASKITTGIFGAGLLPDITKGMSGDLQGVIDKVFQAINGGTSTGNTVASVKTALLNIPGANIVSALAASVIPGLDVSKIISGVFGGGFIPSLDASKITTGTFGTGLIPGLDVAKITSGVFGTSFIPGLDVAKIVSGVFAGGFIPSLDASKVTTGVFGTGLIPDVTKAMSGDLQGVIDKIFQAINGGASTGNTVASVKTGLLAIPGANIATALLASVIPSLDASKITTGAFGAGLIPGLDVSKIVSGVFGTGFIPSLPASQITTGTLATGLIPSLDASKITTGVVSEALTTIGALRDNLVNGLFGGTSGSGYTNTQAVNQATIVAQQASAAAAAAAAAQDTLAQQAQAASAGTGTNFHTPFGGADAAALAGADWSPNNTDILIRGSQGYMGIKAANADGTYATQGLHAPTTNDQRITVVLGDQGGHTSAVTRVLWHCATGTTLGGACLIIANDSLKFGFLSATNVFTQIGSTYTASFNTGTKIDCYNVGNVFTVNVNGTPRITGTDSGALITLSNKFQAVRMDRLTTGGGWFFGPTTYDSFRLSSFGIADYSTATGSSTAAWKISRSSVTNVPITVANGAAANFPAAFFAATDYSSGVTVTTLATGVITIATAGYYELACSVSATQTNPSSATGPGQIAFPWAIAVNGAQATGAIPSGVSEVIHLNAGDTVQPMLSAVGDGQTAASSQTQSNAFAGAPMACTGVRGFAHFSGVFVEA